MKNTIKIQLLALILVILPNIAIAQDQQKYCYFTSDGGQEYYCCEGQIYNKSILGTGPVLRECVYVFQAPSDDVANNIQNSIDMKGKSVGLGVTQVTDWTEPRNISIDELCQIWFANMNNPWAMPIPDNIRAYCETGDASFLE